MTLSVKAVVLFACLLAAPAFTQDRSTSVPTRTDRPSEEALFGGSEPPDAGAPSASTPAEGPAGLEQAPTNGADGGLPPLPTDRPSEDALFGNTAPVRPETPERASERAEAEREAALMQAGKTRNLFEENEALDDPLKIGGQFYQRLLVSTFRDGKAYADRLNAPSIIDGYFDARPNDRLRGMILARMNYDPTLDPNARNLLGQPQTAQANPSILLDQLWMRFDIARTVFVTAGKQHVRWGVARFWMPTDFLHSVYRDPLAPFDVRVGTNMVKLHLPWEERGWNLYGFLLLDTPSRASQPSPANAVDEIGGALRAELVFGQTELGVGVVARKGFRPRLAVDLSTGIGPLDLYLEAAFRDGTGTPLWRRLETPTGPGLEGLFQRYQLGQDEVIYAATGGMTWTVAYSESDTVTFGLEYFHNSIGYTDPGTYPWLILKGEYNPFYVAKHYGAFFVLLNAPGSWERTNFTLSTLGNLTDMTFITRLDMFVRVLTHLNLELFVAGHWGGKGGEFRFALDLPPSTINGLPTPAVRVLPAFIDFGIGLRFSL